MASLDDIALLKIFSHLSTKKLRSISIVNKKWNYLAKTEIKNRKNFLIQTYIGGNSWKRDEKDLQDVSRKMIIEKKDFINELENFIAPFDFSQSKVIICFLTLDFYGTDESIIRENNESILGRDFKDWNTYPVIKARLVFSTVGKIISSVMPSIPTLFVVSRSILGNDLNEYTGNSVRQNKLNLPPCKPAITNLVLSDKPESYRFVTKHVLNNPYELLEIKDENSLKLFFGANQNETLRLVMFFVCSYACRNDATIKEFRKKLRKIKSLSNETLTIAGYHINQCVSSTEEANLMNLVNTEIGFLVLISKNECLNEVRIAQMIIPGANNEDPENWYHPDHPDYPENYHFKLKLKTLKETNIYSDTNENKIFAIVSKGLMMGGENGKQDNDLTEFRHCFPGINIFGINSEDKMGHDHFPGVSRVAPSASNQINYNATFYDHSVFMDSSMYTIISVKN